MIGTSPRNDQLPVVKAAAFHRLKRFCRDEAGVMAPHILIFFVLMILLGGIAVDVMRFETHRVAVQNTLDRATLAAASLEQDLDPREVVEDYFTKAGLGEDLERVTVQQGINFRIVDAYATVVSKNFFMHMLNVPTLETMNQSQAEQRVTNVEIALVLDVSGSMFNSPTRIKNLKTAAKNFVDTVFRNDIEHKISLTIVPYNGHVNLGPELFGAFTSSHRHSYANSYCLDLPATTFTSTSISQVTALPQVPFIDTWSTTTQDTKEVAVQAATYDSDRKLYSNVWCNPVAGNYVRVHNNNITQLKAQIDGLVAIGATSIELGMKWGTALLDPSAKSIVTSMVRSGSVPAYFEGRPALYDDEETMKVIVLMTDGENFEQERIADSYRIGQSPIFRATSDSNRMSRFDATKVDNGNATKLCNSRPYWVAHLGAWHSRPWNGTTPSSSACYSGKTYAAEATAVGKVATMNWNEVWQYARSSWVAWQLYARAIGTTSSTRTTQYNTWMNNFRSVTDVATMDRRLAQVCNTAKASGIEVYGIAFEAPAGGRAAIESCASTPKKDYYFDVSNTGLQDAFAAIASNLSRLRLTL